MATVASSGKPTFYLTRYTPLPGDMVELHEHRAVKDGKIARIDYKAIVLGKGATTGIDLFVLDVPPFEKKDVFLLNGVTGRAPETGWWATPIPRPAEASHG